MMITLPTEMYVVTDGEQYSVSCNDDGLYLIGYDDEALDVKAEELMDNCPEILDIIEYEAVSISEFITLARRLNLSGVEIYREGKGYKITRKKLNAVQLNPQLN